LLLLLVFAAVQCAGMDPGFRKGREDAARDLEAGKLFYYGLGGGLPAPWEQLWVEKLKNEYGVTLRSRGGCVVDDFTAALTDPLIEYSAGYNSMSGPVITEKYGANIFALTEKWAVTEWKKSGAGGPRGK